MRALDIVFDGSFAVAIIALPFFIYSWTRFVIKRAKSAPQLRTQIPVPIRSVLFFVTPIMLALIVASLSTSIAQDEVRDKLESLSGDCRISIDGRAISNAAQVLLVLKTFKWRMAHHSSPTGRIDIRLSDDHQSFNIWLARDSGDPREYWVFYPKYRITSNGEIGRIETSLFESY